jgi:hypothetical protein
LFKNGEILRGVYPERSERAQNDINGFQQSIFLYEQVLMLT